MDVLDDVKEFGLLKFMFPEVNEDDLKAIAEIDSPYKNSINE